MGSDKIDMYSLDEIVMLIIKDLRKKVSFSKLKSKTEKITAPNWRTVQTIQISIMIWESPIVPTRSIKEQIETVKLNAVADVNIVSCVRLYLNRCFKAWYNLMIAKVIIKILTTTSAVFIFLLLL